VSDAISIFCGVANLRLRDVGGESLVDVDIVEFIKYRCLKCLGPEYGMCGEPRAARL
jgi:hypothetical protein